MRHKGGSILQLQRADDEITQKLCGVCLAICTSAVVMSQCMYAKLCLAASAAAVPWFHTHSHYTPTRTKKSPLQFHEFFHTAEKFVKMQTVHMARLHFTSFLRSFPISSDYAVMGDRVLFSLSRHYATPAVLVDRWRCV